LIASARNDRVRALRRLHRTRGRRDRGCTLVEGPKLLSAARDAGADIVEVWADDGSGDVLCSPEVIAALSTTNEPQSPVGVVTIPRWRPLRAVSTVVVWDVADPGNVGSIIRSATALGFDVALTPACADPWSPKVVRAGAGSQFAAHLCRVTEVSELASLATVAALPTGGSPPSAITERPLAILIGNEAHGLPAEVVAQADSVVSLPTSGLVESLNAAVAAGILLWEFAP